MYFTCGDSNSTICCVMVNFMCWLGWVSRCPDTWSNSILNVSVRVLLGEANIWIRKPNTSFLYQCGSDWSNPLEAWIEQMGRVKENMLSLPVSTEYQHSHALRSDLIALGSPESLHTWARTMVLALPGFQLANGRSWDLSASIIVWLNS